MNNLNLQKVLWRDGDIVTENHFQTLENWAENLCALSIQHLMRYGLFRNSLLHENYNNYSNITFSIIEEVRNRESKYQIGIEKFLAINPKGKFLIIEDHQNFNIRIPLSSQNQEGFIYLYLIPKSLQNQSYSDDVETGMVTYLPGCDLSTSNVNNDGIAIVRFKIVSGLIYKDENFIPYGIFVDSSSVSQSYFIFITENYKQLIKLIREYLGTIRPTQQMIMIWNSVTSIYKTIMSYLPIFSMNSINTVTFFVEFKKLINNLLAELEIMTIAVNDQKIKQAYLDLIPVLNNPNVDLNEKLYDLTSGFNTVIEIINSLSNFIGLLPEGPITERQLAIDKVDFIRVAGSNKLIVYLKEKLVFKKGSSVLTIYLKSYTRSEPLNKNVRIGLGDLPFPLLKDNWFLENIPDENHSYKIVCSSDSFESTSVNVITVYVSNPVGEDVPDLTKSTIITIREE
jgi:hypothetical protein